MNKNRKLYQSKNKSKENYKIDKKENSIEFEENNASNLVFSNQESFESKLKKLESKSSKTFLELHPNIENINNNAIYNYLYHGIRFQTHLEKLESIFKDRAILAGNYQEHYYSYDDNCNEGEYISLVSALDGYNIIYKTFIMENISLVISSECNAIKTIYLSYDEWEQLRGRNTKNRYSYAAGEYQVKQMIPIEMVKAIGLPAKYLKITNKEHLIEIYQNDILYLMEKYNIKLPIVDTSDYNKILLIPKNYSSNYQKIKKLNLIKN